MAPSYSRVVLYRVDGNSYIRDLDHEAISQVVGHKKMTYSAEYHRQYYLKNKERKRANAALWAKANPEKVKESARRVREKRRAEGKDVAVRQRWERNHREYVLWNAAKQRCKKSGIEFSIELSDVVIPEICPLLEIPINRDMRGRMQPNSPSLDRINNDLGYVPGNVHVISWKANRIKCDATINELLTFSKNVPDYFQKLMGKA